MFTVFEKKDVNFFFKCSVQELAKAVPKIKKTFPWQSVMISLQGWLLTAWWHSSKLGIKQNNKLKNTSVAVRFLFFHAFALVPIPSTNCKTNTGTPLFFLFSIDKRNSLRNVQCTVCHRTCKTFFPCCRFINKFYLLKLKNLK